MAHRTDLTATTTWQSLDPQTDAVVWQNIGSNTIRLSKGDTAPTGGTFGTQLEPGVAMTVGANQRIWYRTSIGKTQITLSDIS